MGGRAHTTIQNLFTVISEQEMEIEKLRQRLVNECTEFNTYDAFRKLDTSGKGKVSAEALARFLREEVQAEFDGYELELFMLHFDKEQKGAILYSEFCEALVSKSNQTQQELQRRKPQNLKNLKSYDQMFGEHARALYRQLWE